MTYLAVIPARGGSKGIPHKNIQPLCGKKIISYTIEAALQSSLLDHIVVSTDSDEINEVCIQYGVEVINRPPELSTDDSPTRLTLQHAKDQLAARGETYEAVVTLQPTSPLRNNIHIDEAILKFRSSPEADSLVSCVKVPHIYNHDSQMIITKAGFVEPVSVEYGNIARRQDKNTFYARNGAAIYITRSEKISSYVFGGKIVPYVMDPLYSLDIDTVTDLELAEAYIHILGKRGI